MAWGRGAALLGSAPRGSWCLRGRGLHGRVAEGWQARPPKARGPRGAQASGEGDGQRGGGVALFPVEQVGGGAQVRPRVPARDRA